MLGKMAVLSALRRPKRMALIVLAIALSVFVMEFISGWVVGMRDRMQRKILEDSAHLIVERAARLDALDPLEPKNFIENADAVANHFRSDSRVAQVEKVVPFGALVIAGDKNLPLKIEGIESHTGFFSQVSRGSARGSFPFRGSGIAISRRALNLIGAPAAQRLTILVQDAYGAPAYRELPVACVFQTDDSQFDDSTAFIDLKTATDLLGTNGSAELWLRLRNPDEATALRTSEVPYLDAQGCIARTSNEMQGSLLVMIKISDQFILIINVIVLIMAATVITNAILMNVFEKQREYGTLRAIGMKRRQQVFLVLAEGGSQGIAGAILGTALALPVVLYFQRHGLSIGDASHMFGGGDVMFFGLSFPVTLENMGFGFLIALVGSLYAAITGTRSTVVDALKNA